MTTRARGGAVSSPPLPTPNNKAARALSTPLPSQPVRGGACYDGGRSTTSGLSCGAALAGELGLVTKGTLAPPVEAVALSLKENEVSQEIGTDEGLYLLLRAA